ncbi:hypothetical protein B0H19DRAFT_280252 [Mycena capillaripes]|nr:hypothetical protein B0H19DRAFT_280252 [Mycena capillaripes]
MRIQLAYLATTFSTCRPINGNPNFWKLGYYDLKWETGLPATNQMAIGLQPTSKRPKRLVMDYVLMAPVSRPPKRKDRSDKHVSTTEGNGPPAIIEIDDDDDIPSRKKTKRSHPPRGPPGLRTVIPNSSGPERPATRPRRKAAKNLIVLDESSSSSDSEEELPLKRARLNSRFSKPVPDLRFKPHAAISVADAVNNASALNSKPTPNTLRDPPSSAAAPALPRRKPTRQAASTSLAGRASSSSEGSNNQASPSAIQDQLATIIQALSSVQTTQARQAAEVRDIRARLGGQAPENISDSAATIERQSLSTEATVKVVADLVNGLVSALHQPSPSRSIDLFGSGIRTYSSSHRGRGRGRGGVVFGDHARRSMAPNPEDYRPVRPQHPQQEGLLRRHSDTPTTGRYYEQRIWIPGPHNNQERREEHEERGVQFAEERRPPREGSRPRNFTRFSAPIPSGSGSGLDLVLSNRHSRPLSGRRSRFDDGPAVNMQMQLRRQTPVGNARGEAPSVSTEKFFRTLSRRSRSPTPDEQDWEAQYEKDGDHT